MPGRFLLLITAGALLSTSLASAQLPTGAIAGRVLDSSGAVIPGASITITNRETGRVQTTLSSDNGYYKIVLAPGGYDIRIEAASFRPEVRQDLRLEVGREAVLNFTLQVGSVAETVTVLAEAPLVETTSGSLGGLVNEQKISDLPLNGRNFNDLVLLQPGVAVHKTASATAPARVGLSFSANGAPIRSNYQVLDGATLVDARGQNGVSASGAMLGVEGIREFRVITHAFPAEYGMTMGAQMTAVSKSGTNDFHGSLFEYLRNSALDARNFFDRKAKETDPRIPDFRRNNFGGSIGGPILRDKAFFFATYEGVRESLGVSQALDTLTAGARQDGFNGITINPAIKPYLNLYPLPNEPHPNDPTGAQGIGRFTYIFKQPTREDFGQARGDYNFSERDSAFLRYTRVDSERTTSTNFPGYIRVAEGIGHYLTVAENHTFSPTVLNTFRFSYARSDGPQAAGFDQPSLNPALGYLPGQQMGRIVVQSGVSNLGDTGSQPGQSFQSVYTFSNDVFWSRGAHSLKLGVLVNTFRVRGTSSGNDLGTYTFADIPTLLRAEARQFDIRNPGPPLRQDFAFSTFGFYLQDDWHVVPTFTLNLGLRYEFMNTPTETSGNGGGLRDVTRDATFTPSDQLMENSSLRNFGPRVSFAWDVLGDASTALRGGFGLLYDLGNWSRSLLTIYTEFPQFGGESTIISNLTFPRTTFTPGADANIGVFDYYMQQPHMLHYSLTAERQLPWNSALTVSYAGSRGINLMKNREGNPTVPTGLLGGREFYPPIASAQRINPAWGAMELKTAGSDSWYNSLQFGVQKRLSNGLQFQSSYTWSRILDTTQGQDGGESGGTRIVGLDPHHPEYDKGPADFDVPHFWSFNLLYQLPSTGLAGVGHFIFDGWRVGSILNIRNGLPFSVTLSGNRSRSLVESGNTPDRADLVPGKKPDDIILGGPNRYFDPLAFTIQPAGTMGNSGRNMLLGPSTANVDFSLTKEIPFHLVGEGGRWEFRAEVFNLLNRTNFFLPVGVGRSGARVFTADDRRPSLDAVANPTPISTAGAITRTITTARQIQLALKLVF
jgi:outer membrane receptor protein involved in Fe transport